MPETIEIDKKVLSVLLEDHASIPQREEMMGYEMYVSEGGTMTKDEFDEYLGRLGDLLDN